MYKYIYRLHVPETADFTHNLHTYTFKAFENETIPHEAGKNDKDYVMILLVIWIIVEHSGRFSSREVLTAQLAQKMCVENFNWAANI